jgi:hypothetical protein
MIKNGLLITILLIAAITGIGILVLIPYKGTWLERLWEKARYERRNDVERGYNGQE